MKNMTVSSRRLLCLRCLIILYTLMAVIEGKMDRMVKPLATPKSAETSSRSGSQFHIASDSTTNRLLTSPTDSRSPRQPDSVAKTPWDAAAAAAAGSSGRVIIRKTRQVDPLHSCIEAKCSGWKSSEYLNCIYHHCINGMESSSSRFGRDITRRMVEGRQAERMVLWKRQLSGGAARMAQGKTLLGTRTFPEKIGQFERIGSGMNGQVNLVRGSEAEPFVPVVASVPGAILSMGFPKFPVGRRGFNDISDVCKERNCGPYQQTVEYFNCIENIVDCPTLLR